ncbi:ABC-2 family transporter protein [Maioricimonas rarisocia]|uniref:ABC-2 family transporter protein n=1 Tax=Maioricimonas rarisocia TaxID=2528026 RepID=A0A517Z2I7_9PLAN|nr:ABC transporter permease subunit [Maioricimonas rarisocia]QDU36659.1 ABC-2 family transporter protein [Maioricimonas rarisocia]
MLAGPIFSREALTAPRQLNHYLLRSGYIAALLVLIYTAAQATFGFREIRNAGDMAQFGTFVFDVLAFVQLSLAMAAALLFGSSNVAQEKDRRTLILLLMTDLRNHELVVGKLLAGLLAVLMLIGVSLPVFCLLRMMGGITLNQVLWIEVLCLTAALAAGAWGSLVAFWRDKTFQTLAISVLGLVIFIGVVEGAATLAASGTTAGRILGMLNPYRALLDLLHPLSRQPDAIVPTVAAWGSVLALLAISVSLSALTIYKVRLWNPSRFVFEQAKKKEEQAEVRKQARTVWNTPIIWREICTRAYGRKILLIKFAYLIMSALTLLAVAQADSEGMVLGMLGQSAFAFVGLSILSLLLTNAQAVTAFTSERDGQTLELLLVTEVTAPEFIYGKLGGILYNTKELIAVPLIFLGWFLAQGQLTLENTIYIGLGFVTLSLFAAMLGLHAGLTYDNSRTAIANSLGTMFFLFVGIFICMVLMIEARASYEMQLIPFLVFILGGALGLWASLTHKNPSSAFLLASAVLPFCTFYAIASYLLGATLGVALFVVVAYGFTTIAMLVPAVSEFDVALGRTTHGRG